MLARTALALAIALAPIAAAQAAAPGATPVPDKTTPGKTGKEVYEQVCSACHATGVLNAPKLGDARTWKPLIAEGVNSLTRTAIKGIRQMPPRGGNPSLTDIEIRRAVTYMANGSGGKFPDPK
jgi:cytochrome c5